VVGTVLKDEQNDDVTDGQEARRATANFGRGATRVMVGCLIWVMQIRSQQMGQDNYTHLLFPSLGIRSQRYVQN